MYKQSEVKKDYECKICKAEWTQLEVLDKVGPQGFECHRCGAVLDMIEQKAGASTGHEKQSRLMSQLEGLLKMLQQVDSEDIPNNTFEMAMSNQIPVPRDSTFDPSSRTTIPIGGPNGPPSAVKGMTQVANVPLSVSLTTSSEKTAYEKAVEAQQKADIAAQNALPVWHTKSTVNGESTVVARGQSEQLANGASLARDEQEEKKDSNALNDELTAYYAQLAKEKAQEEKEEQEADESSGDEDDEDFEDVGIGESGVGTASSSMPTDPTKAQERQLNGSARPKASESGSSRATSNVATPADTGTGVEDEGGSVAKKVKFETQEIETIAGKADKDSDEDDEAEFEDAL